MTGKFEANPGVEVDEDYVDKISEIIYKKYQISRLILEKDYYRKLWEALGKSTD